MILEIFDPSINREKIYFTIFRDIPCILASLGINKLLTRIKKSVNLQYIKLGCLDDGTNESSTKSLMFQVLFFFMISFKILCKNPFNLFSYFFYKITKIKIKSFECPKALSFFSLVILLMGSVCISF